MQLMLGTVESSTLTQTTNTKSISIGRKRQTIEHPQKAVQIKAPLTQIIRKTVQIVAKHNTIPSEPLRPSLPSLPPPPPPPPPSQQQRLHRVVASTSAAAAVASVSKNLKYSVPSQVKDAVVRRRPYKTVSAAPNCSNFTANAKSPASVAIRSPARCGHKMEHSYVRDCVRPKYELVTGLSPARTILVRRPPQCPSCHLNPLEEGEMEDRNQVPVPTFNEIAAKEAMCECARIAKYVKNTNPDNDDWESRIQQYGWTSMQKSIFGKVARILDDDQLGRLSNAGRQNEAMQRRVIIDKSAKRMRKALASVSWDPRLTQWLHCLLMDCLPATYMASYLDILQTLKSKLPTLMDKMLFGRPMNVSQELLAPVMKKKWEPIITTNKSLKLTHNAVIVALPSMPTSGPVPPRMQKWYQHLASITQVVQVSLPMTGTSISRQPLEQVAEQIVSLTRVKIQEMRNENPTRNIILIGFNAGSALALQVAMSENVNCVICMGFAFNTLHGVRGMPDDRLLDIKTPILFVIGQNSARTSPEEVESLREKMQSDSSLVVVGSADDLLRIPKIRRKIENVTQAMVDTMIVDEVFEFIKNILNKPPGPRVPTSLTVSTGFVKPTKSATAIDGGIRATPGPRKRKLDPQNAAGGDEPSKPAKTKYVSNMGRPRTRPLTTGTAPNPAKGAKGSHLKATSAAGGGKLSGSSMQQKKSLSSNSISNEDLNLAIQSILSDSNEQEAGLSMNATGGGDASKKMATNFEFVTQSRSGPIKTVMNPLKQQLLGTAGGTPTIGTKIKMIPANQFVQLKPPLQSQSKIYTIKTAAMLNNSAGAALNGNSAGIGSIVTTGPTSAANINSGQQQIFTLKSPNGQTTQFVTAAAPAQQKYTVMKPVTTSVAGGGNLDLSNIIDMPIIFADNDGNISDTVSATTTSDMNKVTTTPHSNNSSSVGQLIISQQIIKEANNNASPVNSGSGTGSFCGSGNTFVFNNKPLNTGTQSKPNKVVFINRNTMKPCPNILSRSSIAHNLPKYTKVVVTNAKSSAPTVVQRATGQSPLVSTVKQVNLQTLKSPLNNGTSQMLSSSTAGGILNGSKQIQILNKTSGTGNGLVTTEKPQQQQPQIRNIVVKPGGLKQIPDHLKTQLFNRSLTVRKLVNIVPASKATVTTTKTNGIIVGGGSTPTSPQQNVSVSPSSSNSTVGGGGVATSASSSITSSIQTSPKIITLNPINPVAVATTQSKASTSSD